MARRRTANAVEGAPAAPLVGAPFRLDGHNYILTGINSPRAGLFQFGKGHGTQKGAVRYKAGAGVTADLAWCNTAEEYAALVNDEAEALIRGRPVMRNLARAAAQALIDHHDSGACWYLPGRHLPRLDNRPPNYTPAEAAAVALKLVDPLGQE
jgi:hypothetical protein